MSAPTPPTNPFVNQVPSVDSVENMLGGLVGALLLIFRNNRVDAMSVNSVGTILEGLKLGTGKQTPAEVNALIRSVAEAQVERIKTKLLRDSIGSVN